jgi:hypothetical protein
VRAVNHSNIDTSYVQYGSTKTLYGIPETASFDKVNVSSITVSWTCSGTPDGFLLEADQDPGFSSVEQSSVTTNISNTDLTVESLNINTTYYLRVGSIYAATTNWMTTPVNISTATLAVLPHL